MTFLLLGLVVALAVVIRLPLFHLPLDPDEGGYAYIASRWAAGAQLYSAGAWVDRPQGLMLVFRLVSDLSYTATAVRIGAMVAGSVLALGAAAAAWAVAGRRAAVIAGVLTAVIGAGAFIQGYEFNGELIASAVGVLGVAVAFWWRRGSLGTAWLVLAGALCASAVLVKQSALDPLVVLALVVATESVRRRSQPGRQTRSWPAVVAAGAGAMLPLGAALIDAATTGWSRWWNAVVSFQSGVAGSVGLATRIRQQGLTLLDVLPDLLGVAIVAAIGVVALRRSARAGRATGTTSEPPGILPVPDWPLLIWPVVAVVEVLAGPFAHRHYWVQAVAPLAVLGGVAIARRPMKVAVALTALALAVPLGTQAFLATQSPRTRAVAVVNDPRLVENIQVSAWLREHTKPGDSVYAFVASADLYLLAGRRTTYPYLWYANVQGLPDAHQRLSAMLDGPGAPMWVVLYQDPSVVDPSGSIQRILDRRYTEVATIDGVPVLKLSDATAVSASGPLVGTSMSNVRYTNTIASSAR